MPTAFITGANRGIGLEFTRQYLDKGWHVIATCRKPSEAVSLLSFMDRIQVEALDVSDHLQIQSLARTLKRERIDILINNAGIHGPRPSRLGGVDYTAWEDVLLINTMGPMKVR